MSSDPINEVYKQFRTAQDKYAYFLLAAAGAGIALAVNQTHGARLSWSQAPLGGAVLMWAASFFSGCRHLEYLTSSLYANLELLRVKGGKHPDVGTNPELIAAASEEIRKAVASNSECSSQHAGAQSRFLIWGATLYVVWHVLEMWLRSLQ
jgi:hypothetical protein